MSALCALRRRRPFGVYVIAFFLALRILDFFFETVRVQRAGLPSLLLPSTANPALQTSIRIAGTVFLVLIIIGVLRLKRWALITTTLLAGISLAFGLWLYAQGRPQYLNMFASVLIAFYLNQREVQQAFDTQRPAE